MAKRVPLARRNILAERRRLVMSLLGVGAAVALVLLLQGLWSGTRLQVSAYQDNVEADLYVAEIGTKNFATDNSVVPEGIGKSIGELPKVDGVAPIISRWALLDLHARKQGVALIGSQPGQMGGPWRFSAGRAVEAADEVAVDEVTADQHGLSLGDTIEVIGHDVEIVGLVSGARTWMTGMAFVSLDALQEMQRTPRAVSFLLVDTAQPEEVAAQIRERFDVTTLGAAEGGQRAESLRRNHRRTPRFHDRHRVYGRHTHRCADRLLVDRRTNPRVRNRQGGRGSGTRYRENRSRPDSFDRHRRHCGRFSFVPWRITPDRGTQTSVLDPSLSDGRDHGRFFLVTHGGSRGHRADQEACPTRSSKRVPGSGVMGRVPIARRSLFSERRRALLGVGGVVLALLIVLALDGIFAGAMKQVTRYIDTADADLFVSQQGVRNMHMSSSSIPLSAVDRVQQIEGVTSVSPVLYESSVMRVGGQRQLSYFFGYRTGKAGGPTRITKGGPPGPGEIIVDSRTADALGLDVGDEVAALGRDWRIAGFTSGMITITNTVSYVPFEDFARARGLQATASFLLVRTDDPEKVLARVETATGLTTLSQEQFSREERQIVQDMSADLMRIMTIAALLIGLAVVALVLYSATLARLREVGVMKALGSSNGGTAGVVLAQAAWTVLPATVLAVSATAVLAWVLSATGSDIAIAIEPRSVVRTAIGALVLGAVGAITPLARITRVDPATVFRR